LTPGTSDNVGKYYLDVSIEKNPASNAGDPPYSNVEVLIEFDVVDCNALDSLSGSSDKYYNTYTLEEESKYNVTLPYIP